MLSQKKSETDMYTHIPVLDKGFVRLVDTMGDDSAVVQAARVSYAKGTKTYRQDEKLIRFLLKHLHTTPFEMCEIKLHIKAPLFVTQQWLRHRTANVNAQSARYSIVEEEFYLPSADVVQPQALTNRQGREGSFDANQANDIILFIKESTQNAYKTYQDLLARGVARELARIVLPVNMYTEFYWKIDLHNLMRFLMLRCAQDAQYEIRAYAKAILEIFKNWMPVTYRAFDDYILNSVHIGKQEINVLKKMIQKEEINLEEYDVSVREYNRLKEIFTS